MPHRFWFIVIILTNIVSTYQQVIFQHDFDKEDDPSSYLLDQRGFGLAVTVGSNSIPGSIINLPLSDVTSILTPNKENETCVTPYSVSSYMGDVYFCTNKQCKSASGSLIACNEGKFAYIDYDPSYTDLVVRLNSTNNIINGIGQQCLIFFYYMELSTNPNTRIDTSILESTSGVKQIDSLQGTPCNGWIRRQVQFDSSTPYELNFTIRTGQPDGNIRLFAFDEISIVQGTCDEPATSKCSPHLNDTTRVTMPITTTPLTTTPSSTSTVAITSTDTTTPTSADTVTPTSADTVTPTSADTVASTSVDTVASTSADTVAPTSTDTTTTASTETTTTTSTGTATPTSPGTMTTTSTGTATPTSPGTMTTTSTGIATPTSPGTVTPTSSATTTAISTDTITTTSLIDITTTVPATTISDTTTELNQIPTTNPNDEDSSNKTLIIALSVSIGVALIVGVLAGFIIVKTISGRKSRTGPYRDSIALIEYGTTF